MSDLVKALQKRGFFIVEEDDYFTLGKGSHPKDLMDLKQMLDRLNISVTFQGEKVIMTGELDDRKIHEIIWYPARNHEAGGDGGWRSWKYFINGMYGPKVRTITLETGVALFIKSLSAAGVRTISSCDGHGKKSPYISFFGLYNACWFMVLYKNLLSDLDLNYNWRIEDKGFSDPHIIANSNTGKWDLRLVVEDTQRMASVLLQNSKRISELKRELFGANRKSTRKVVKEMSVEELIVWMEQRYMEKGFH
ncbi:hypothetical protein [Fredinandcohnia quinoae]|uniref:LAGLIDADG homing endonuclease n=1 Tax=Fredinandcohnia quinoae TaxID=2918902 RepID=A0AAW5E184_9BACI|nr:hypothetical protein [Fredinandcohnia sp. SECRCQ15]MCH1624484.1 hypothetical protein [Fredinandcohnia sp. SECRCQ15]